ncbi:HAMP domain-containing sensor histidine kinase [Pseudonocardia humida]|uniref:histidine kinase n=1 Tax=Pseudonocardia humida TaxID=2800819 RepID=A0ABT0ZV83_9PSEU|nr:histidine kinase [Pseudonocardia humida]MCO1654653.1 HAMP domain-containing protein [Pseudonocardia humida]
MPVAVRSPPAAGGSTRPVRTAVSALFWRLFVVNGVVFSAGAAVLVLSPATVSAPVVVTEISVLAVGLIVLLVVSGFLLRESLRPLDGLTALMQRVDLLRPGQRIAVSSGGDFAYVVRTFNEMLDRLEAERGVSTARALAAQEGERQRIARELHDEIGQSMTVVLLGLKRSVDRAPEGLRDELCAVQEMVRSSLDEVRQIARRLRPGVLDDLGLLSAMNALAGEFVEASGVALATRLDDRLPVLDGDAELVLYRIAQEGLTNIARHAGAAHAELSLTGDGDRVELRIRDDGRGIDDEAEGAGIRGMRERALLVGADLTVDPAPSGGTEVRLVVPTARARERGGDGTA